MNEPTDGSQRPAMRLTLRTLLAYLDNQLDAEDAASLAEKIESSEAAGNLVNRINDVTRRLRLGAPKLAGRGVVLDPNTVAEYLDNTLSTERVPDFEKLCLDSDMHLAEVAAAHQILALVLSDPAEVDSESRKRMYEIGLHADAASETADQPSEQPPAEEPVEAVAAATPNGEAALSDRDPQLRPRRRPEVPEYLRDRESWRGSVMAGFIAVALLIGFAFVVYMATRPTGMIAAQAEGEADEANAAALPDAGTGNEGSESDRDSSAPSGEDAENEQPSPAGNTNQGTDDAAPPVSDEDAGSDLIVPPDRGLEPAAAMPDEDLDEPPSPDDVPTDTPEDGEGSNDQPMPADGGDEQAVAVDDGPPVETGVFSGGDELLVRFDSEADTWMLVPAEQPVFSGDLLVGLPKQTTSFTLSDSVRVRLLEDTRVRLLRPEDGQSGLHVLSGFVLLEPNPANAPAAVRLVLGNRQGTAVLNGPATQMAIAVIPYREPGLNPEQEPARLAIDMFVVSGSVEWQDAVSETSERFDGPALRRLEGPSPEPVSGELGADMLPPWTKGRINLSPLDRRAAGDVREYLNVEQPVTIRLEELAGDRRSEIRSLAARSLASLGEFGAVLTALDDEAHRADAAWQDHIDALARALLRGPQTAVRLQETLIRQRPADAELIYRLLWGYSPEQIQAGEGAQLVELLDDDRLAVRSLAFWNLRNVTGMSLYYRPHDKHANRQQAVQRWRQRLEEGLLPEPAPVNE